MARAQHILPRGNPYGSTPASNSRLEVPTWCRLMEASNGARFTDWQAWELIFALRNVTPQRVEDTIRSLLAQGRDIPKTAGELIDLAWEHKRKLEAIKRKREEAKREEAIRQWRESPEGKRAIAEFSQAMKSWQADAKADIAARKREGKL